MAPVFKSQIKGSDEISLSKITDIFAKRWHIILIFFLISVGLSKLYLRYTKPMYEARGTMKVEDNNTTFRSLGILQGFDNFTDNIQTEIQIIKSRRIVQAALDRMNVDVSYYKVGTLLTSELYKDSPFRIEYDREQAKLPANTLFSIEFLGENKFELSFSEGIGEERMQYYFGEKIMVDGFEFQVFKEDGKRRFNEGALYKFKVNKPGSLVARARNGLKIEQVGVMVPILRISHRDHVARFATDFVNNLCQVYADEEMLLKQQAASQALNFISEQLDTLEEKVRLSEIRLEQFKKDKEILNVEQKGIMDLERFKELEGKRAELDLNMIAIDQLEKQIAGRDRNLKPFPFNLDGGVDVMLNGLVSSYNDLSLERMEMLQKYTANSPKIIDMDNRLTNLADAISDHILAIRNNNYAKSLYYENETRKVKSNLSGIPSTERTFINLEREYKVNESVLSTLLEKRAEASIAKATIVPSVRIVDKAMVPSGPVSPQSSKIYIMGGGIGICIGAMLILITGMMKNTISYREEIENLSLTPVIGVVRRSPISLNNKYPKLVILENPKSALSESIRSIRTNLQFISSDKKSKVIAITSTVSGEGKSYITINLAGIISLLNRKVVILDLDLRKPKLHYSFGKDNSVGLSTFLVGKSDLKDIKVKTEYENLDLITSGPIPPNPAELLQSLRMELLLMELRKTYDYILVDTPPIGLVTDGTALLRVSDITLYVIRSDYSKKAYANIPDQLVEDHKVKNLYIVLNSVAQGGGKYGRYGKYGGYGRSGSGYYVEESIKIPWWRKILKQKSKGGD
ncbi:MAG: polysaccharide biosynthesis tyrosine autokinase [Bacteroidia bacterium]|nr:polysaccharide biosynthesis tyrosine autokinase [Bacteroidia bacterium]